MHRIDSSGSVGGMFTDGQPGDTEATVVSEDWLNAVQEEVVAVVLASGASLSKPDNTQLRTALYALFGRLAQANTWTLLQTLSKGATATGDTNAAALTGVGNGTGPGVAGTGGATNGIGAVGQGTGSGAGVAGTGGATGPGVTGAGGATSGAGGTFTASAGNSNGVNSTGNGTGSGVVGTGGATGIGVVGTGGAGTGNYGVRAIGTGAFAGLYATGEQGVIAEASVASGIGVQGVGGSAGPGVRGTGGATSGTGVDAIGTGSGAGLTATPGSSGVGINVTRSASRGNIQIVPSAGDPTSPSDGDMWLNLTTGELKVRVGGVTKTATLT
jgi:hypothetical protein